MLHLLILHVIMVCIPTSYFCDGWVGNGSVPIIILTAQMALEDADCCGIGDNNYTEEVCAEDCAGVIFGDAVVDCNGDCGTAVVDECVM